MKMKKFFALLLSLSMVLSLAACGSKGNSNDSQTDGETASDLHLGYDLNTGENHYGPYYDEWSDKTDEELFEEALKEDTTINVYATSSKMMKVEEGFEAAYPGLDLVVSDLRLTRCSPRPKSSTTPATSPPTCFRPRTSTATCSTSGTIRTFWSLTSPGTSALTSTRKT